MPAKTLLLLALLFLCSACVSRTVVTRDPVSGTQKEIIENEKLIWFWQDDFSK